MSYPYGRISLHINNWAEHRQCSVNTDSKSKHEKRESSKLIAICWNQTRLKESNWISISVFTLQIELEIYATKL